MDLDPFSCTKGAFVTSRQGVCVSSMKRLMVDACSLARSVRVFEHQQRMEHESTTDRSTQACICVCLCSPHLLVFQTSVLVVTHVLMPLTCSLRATANGKTFFSQLSRSTFTGGSGRLSGTRQLKPWLQNPCISAPWAQDIHKHE
jgi:hypothetical protein